MNKKLKILILATALTCFSGVISNAESIATIVPNENINELKNEENSNKSQTQIYKDDFQYVLKEDGTVKITAYTGKQTKIYIPSNIGNYKVTEIGTQAFSSCTCLAQIEIPKEVIVIADSAFQGCGKFVIYGYENSCAQFFAQDNNISFKLFSEYDVDVASSSIATKYIVKFLNDDGTQLKVQKVEKGSSAEAPQNPQKEGYTFKGWDKDFSNITSDMVVQAVYDKNYEIATTIPANVLNNPTIGTQKYFGHSVPESQIEKKNDNTNTSDNTNKLTILFVIVTSFMLLIRSKKNI